MKRSLTALALVLALLAGFAGFATVAHAGDGESCDHHAKATKTADRAAHGWLGVETEKAESGYAIVKVHADSPAAEAGFQPGDVLVAMNGIRLSKDNHKALKKAKSRLGVGSEVEYTVRRSSGERTLTATLAPVPEAVLAEWEAEEKAATRVAENE